MLKGFKNGEGEQSIKFNKQRLVFGACAGAALYRREMLEQIGFLDEDFFLIHEDTDLNFRAQLAGWKVLYVPTAIVHHKVRSSIGIMSDMAIYYSLRNNELMRIKSIPFGIFLRCFPELILGAVSEFLYFALKHRRFKLFITAKRDAMKMLPQMWKKRKMIMRTRKVSNGYLLSLMTPIWRRDFIKTKLGKFLHG
jgi:GT2 family glycosyltransferase